MTTKDKLLKIIELLNEADCLQQEVVQDNVECYSIHNQLDNLAATFEDMLEKHS